MVIRPFEDKITNCMEQSQAWEAKSSSDSKQTARILRNPMFIIVFTTARHLSASGDTQIQSTSSHPVH
jgi:hypothetical protein